MRGAYSDYKGSNEQNTFGLKYGLVLQAVYNNSWELQTGANYTEYTFNQPEIKYQLKDSFPYLNQQGQIIYWIYKNYRDTIVKPRTTKLRYKTLSIPLQLGKVIELNPKWSMFVQAGTQVTVILKADGSTVTSSLELRDASALPMKKIHVGWNGTIGVAYRIKPSFIIRVDGSYANLTGNLYESSYDAKAVLNNIGFKTSLMYELGKKK